MTAEQRTRKSYGFEAGDLPFGVFAFCCFADQHGEG
jgi:hypothetical protein